jgi:sugar/nucleoside kinase (ribokinase family)
MENLQFTDFLLIGKLACDTIIPLQGPPRSDIPGGSLFYSAAGLGVWENRAGLIGRVGEDFPQEWIDRLSNLHFDTRGIHLIPEALDLRKFIAHLDGDTSTIENPPAQFLRIGAPIPKDLIGYLPAPEQVDSRVKLISTSIRISDIPQDYLDATAAHICPLDFLTHSLLPSALRRGHITTITADFPTGTLDPILWDEIPALIKDLTAFHTTETKLSHLFQGRSSDLWEMAEALASYGCDCIVIKRKSQGQYLYIAPTKTRWIIPAYPARLVDPTGCGDAFCGGFLSGYRIAYDYLEAALFGNISASIVIEGTGPFYALESMPGLAKARLESLREKVRKA